MSNYDLKLRDGLTAEDEAFLKDLEDRRGLFSQIGDTFSGPLGPWTVFAWVLSLAFFVFSIFCVFRLTDAESTQAALLWMTGALGSWISVGLVKIWFWMRMNHLATLRELKRIELRLIRSGGA